MYPRDLPGASGESSQSDKSKAIQIVLAKKRPGNLISPELFRLRWVRGSAAACTRGLPATSEGPPQSDKSKAIQIARIRKCPGNLISRRPFRLCGPERLSQSDKPAAYQIAQALLGLEYTSGASRGPYVGRGVPLTTGPPGALPHRDFSILPEIRPSGGSGAVRATWLVGHVRWPPKQQANEPRRNVHGSLAPSSRAEAPLYQGLPPGLGPWPLSRLEGRVAAPMHRRRRFRRAFAPVSAASLGDC